MGGVLRWGDRDMLQPSDWTREKKKRKNILLFFLLFVEEDSFLPLEQRVELKIDLAGATTLWKNQDVTCPGTVECLVLISSV